MNHGPPPSAAANAANMFGFAAPATMNQMALDNQNDMMAMLDSPMFDNFNQAGPMSYDGLPDMALQQQQPPQGLFSSASSASNPPSTLVHSDSRYSTVSEDSPGPSNNMNFGAASVQPSVQSSTLTEFTKRRNWPAKVVEELKDFLQILDAHGKIKYVSPSVTALTGYKPNEIVDEFLKELIHPDDMGTFTSEMNESIATGAPLRMFYRLKKKDGDYAIFESVGHAHIASAKFAPNPDNNTAFCQAVFVMSRPYPTRNASLLDSFLEHKIENERLRRRIAELRREEEEDEASQQSWLAGQEANTEMTPSDDHGSSTGATYYPPTTTDSQTMPPPERPASLNLNLTRENLEGATAGARPDSIRDKMARYEGASHAETIEMLTGLRYVEGERSVGITTGNASPTLVKGDAGIAIPVDRDPRTGEKKKKQKVAEEYVCTDCGTLDSPEWRKGPSGPKTLCNACGLRWAKKEKKKNNVGGAGTASHGQSMPLVEP